MSKPGINNHPPEPLYWKRLIGVLFWVTVVVAQSQVTTPSDPAADKPPGKYQGVNVQEAFAQDTMSGTEIERTLEDPIALLLKQNRELKAAELAYQAARERIKIAGTLPDPMVESNLYQAPIETANGPMEWQAMLGQKFPLWGKLRRERNVAELEAEVAALKWERKQVMVVFRMRREWENYLKLKRSLEILDRYRAELATFRSIALTQYSTGAGMTQHPILKLQIEISLIESQINTFESRLESIVNNLQALFDGTFSPTLFGERRMEVLPTNPPEYWLERARTSHPGYRQTQREVQIAVLQNELAVRQNYPDLVTGLAYTAIGEATGGPDPGADAVGIKVGLNLPLWFNRNRARIESTRLKIGSQEEMVAEVWNRIEDGVRSTVKDLEEIQETYLLYEEKLVQESEQMLASAYAAYETGKISFLDLLDSERMVVRVRLDFEAIEADRRITSANMVKDIGLIHYNEE